MQSEKMKKALNEGGGETDVVIVLNGGAWSKKIRGGNGEMREIGKSKAGECKSVKTFSQPWLSQSCRCGLI